MIDNSAGDYDVPTVYVRGDTVRVTARFKLWDLRPMYPDATPRTPYIGGSGYAVSFPPTPATIQGDTLSVTLTASAPLPNCVHMNGGIHWGLGWGDPPGQGNGNVQPAQQNIKGGGGLLYVTLGQPATDGPLYHTVVHVSTAAAMWVDTPQQVIDKTWEAFKTRKLTTASPAFDDLDKVLLPPELRRVAKPLHYYKEWNTLSATTKELLETGDGKCGAWGLFMADTLKVHGIAAKAVPVEPKPNPTTGLIEAFAIQRWDFQGAGGSGNADYPYGNLRPADDNYMLKVDGVWQYKYDATDVPHATGKDPDPSTGRGQGNTIPKAIFIDHALVRIGDENKLYDPSYGTGPFVGTDFNSALNKWEDASVAGFHAPQLKNSSRTPGRWEHFFRKNVTGVLESKQG